MELDWLWPLCLVQDVSWGKLQNFVQITICKHWACLKMWIETLSKRLNMFQSSSARKYSASFSFGKIPNMIFICLFKTCIELPILNLDWVCEDRQVFCSPYHGNKVGPIHAIGYARWQACSFFCFGGNRARDCVLIGNWGPS